MDGKASPADANLKHARYCNRSHIESRVQEPQADNSRPSIARVLVRRVSSHGRRG